MTIEAEGNQFNRFSTEQEFNEWLRKEVIFYPTFSVQAADLFDRWFQFATERGYFPGSRQLFGRRLSRMGFKSRMQVISGKNSRFYKGLRAAA